MSPAAGLDCARLAMTLMGAEALLYPTAIGSEPHDPDLDTAQPWRRAMQGHAVSNIIPLIQLALVFRLHPVGRGSVIATFLTVVAYLAVPLAIRMVLGGGWISLGVSAVAGTLLLLAGVLRFRRALKLQGMPGLGKLAKRWSALTASRQGQQG